MGATPAAALVRPQSGERLRIGRALDLGAHGIMVPRVDMPEQAREAISFMRYPPDGARGLALGTRGAGLGELGHTQIQAINRRILGIIQIESRSAVDTRRRDRRHRRRRCPVRRPDRPVAQPRHPRPLRRSGLSRRAAARRGQRRGRREGRRASCCATRRRCRATSTSGSGSSGSARTRHSSPMAGGPWSAGASHHEFDSLEIVEGEAILAHQPAQPATEREPGDPRAGDHPARYRQTMQLRLAIELGPGDATLRPPGRLLGST